MKELIEYLVKSLVVDEESVVVTEKEDNGDTVYHVTVNEDDMGRVIGKGGKVASSIRAIVKSISARQHKNVFVKFGE